MKCYGKPGDAEVTRAACCAACAPAQADRPDGVCRVDGVSLRLRVLGKGGACPLGRHPDGRGRVTWGPRWWWHIGLPVIQRAWLWSTRFGHLDGWEFMRALPGCGCWGPLKNAISATTAGAGGRGRPPSASRSSRAVR